MEIFVVYLYCDYHKEVDIQHLKAFKCPHEAKTFALKYSCKPTEPEYVYLSGYEYDAPLSTDKDLIKELNIKSDMWYIRIAINKIILT